MLDRVDRVLIAVKDRRAAVENYHALLGTEVVAERPSERLGCERTVLALGTSEVELCQPHGEGPVADHLEQWGEGLFAGGVSTPNPIALQARLASFGVPFATENEQILLEPEAFAGTRLVISPSRARRRVGLATHLYELTNTLVSPWRPVVERCTRMFGLDAGKFAPISSERFGYDGMLTLFDPPARLDRFEIVTASDPKHAMGRFAQKRGDALYMCYIETDDLPEMIRRLDARRVKWTPRQPDPKQERDGLWIHPSGLNGLLLGVSRTGYAWTWSGRPELVKPAA